MSTRTTTTKSSTTNNRGRGRGRGRGRQTNQNSNFRQQNIPNEDMDEIHPYNERRRGPPTFAHNRGGYQPANRGLGNFRGNNIGNVRSDRSANSGRSSTPDSNPDRIPKHAQNPIFVGELMSRFSSMLPSPSFMEDEAAGAQQPEVNVNTNPVPNISTLDTLRNTSTPRSSSKNSGFYNQNGNTNHENKRLEVERNWNQGENYVKCTNEGEPQFGHQNQAGYFSGRDTGFGNVRINDYYDLPVNTSNASVNDNCKKNHNSKREHNSENYHIKTSKSSNNSTSPIALKTVPLEKRKAIMKSLGFSVEPEDQNSDSSHGKASDSNQPPQNFRHGLIADRTSPRVRYNIENEPSQNIFPPAISEQNDHGNSRLKLENLRPQNSSVVDVEKYNRPYSRSPGNTHDGNPLHEKSSDGNVMYSVKETAAKKTPPSAISETFFSQLDTMRGSSNGSINDRSPSESTSVRKHKNRQETNENRPSPSTVNKFNPFLKTEQTSTPQDHPERSSSLKQRRQKYESYNHNPALFQFPPYPHRLTERDVAGRNHFNVQRPARDMNERVPSREEALERIQEQYEIQRAEYETKKREKSVTFSTWKAKRKNTAKLNKSSLRIYVLKKEAKKREEYLARYKHVDQGYRLNDGLLDEAAGYAPSYNQNETVVDIRQRQQEQLRQDALAYQELQREEREKQKRREEKKAKEKLEKNKHVDAGYRLGRGDNRGNSRWASNTRFKNKQPKKSSRETSDNKDFRDSISPELLLEGETEEEAIQRQEEQLILEMIIQEQMRFQAQNKLGTEDEENVNDVEDNKTQRPANSVSMNPFLSAKQTPKSPSTGSTRNVAASQLNQSGGSSGAVPKHPESKYSKDFENNNEQLNRQILNAERNIPVEAPNPPTEPEHFGTKRQNKSPQLEQVDSKVSKNSTSQGSSSSQIPCGPEPLPKKPASCILKNQNGAVLVLRPSSEDLNRALARRLEVQDEMDKLGYSAHYKPTPEQVPLYCNNRFERKPGFDTERPATGAIPKNTSGSAIKPASTVTTNAATNIETPKQDEPPLDHKAELMAARLRFQQQYEEALKKKQEQKNES